MENVILFHENLYNRPFPIKSPISSWLRAIRKVDIFCFTASSVIRDSNSLIYGPESENVEEEKITT